MFNDINSGGGFDSGVLRVLYCMCILFINEERLGKLGKSIKHAKNIPDKKVLNVK